MTALGGGAAVFMTKKNKKKTVDNLEDVKEVEAAEE